MSMNNGGPAFPVTSPVYHDADHGELLGMSLRDWFAGQALAGIMASPGTSTSATPMAKAAYAYQFADAMISQQDVVNAEFTVNTDQVRLVEVAQWMLEELHAAGRRGALIDEAKAIIAKLRPTAVNLKPSKYVVIAKNEHGTVKDSFDEYRDAQEKFYEWDESGWDAATLYEDGKEYARFGGGVNLE